MTFSVLALLIVGLQLVLMVLLSGDRGEGVGELGPRRRVEKAVQRHHRIKQAARPRGKILGTVRTDPWIKFFIIHLLTKSTGIA